MTRPSRTGPDHAPTCAARLVTCTRILDHPGLLTKTIAAPPPPDHCRANRKENCFALDGPQTTSSSRPFDERHSCRTKNKAEGGSLGLRPRCSAPAFCPASRCGRVTTKPCLGDNSDYYVQEAGFPDCPARGRPPGLRGTNPVLTPVHLALPVPQRPTKSNVDRSRQPWPDARPWLCHRSPYRPGVVVRWPRLQCWPV